MSGIVGQNLGRGSGLVKATAVVADSVTGASIADDAIDSEHYTDGSIDNAHIADDAIDSEHYAAASIDNAHLADNAADTDEIADNAITLAKMAGGTDGNIISFDASGDPVAIATGTDGQVLTSAGAGQPPAMEDAGGAVTALNNATANELVTVGSTTTELDAETNLTYSTDLSITSGNIEIVTDGKGIDFGSSSTSKILDDYEEGTWTPTITGTSGASGQAYGVQQGNYTKIGNLVNIQGYVSLSTQGTLSGTYLAVGGFPLAGVTTIDNGACATARVEQIRVSSGWIGPDCQFGSGFTSSFMMEHEASGSASVSHRAVGGVGPDDATTDTSSIAMGLTYMAP